MPGMSGLQTSLIIRELYEKEGVEQPYIACVTAYQKDYVVEVAEKADIDDIFQKPMTQEDIGKIKKVLGQAF